MAARTQILRCAQDFACGLPLSLTPARRLNFGFDAQAGEFTDLVKAGVIDPTKVTRCALQNAGSIAALMLTTEAMVAEIPEEKKDMARPGGHGGGMGDMY